MMGDDGGLITALLNRYTTPSLAEMTMLYKMYIYWFALPSLSSSSYIFLVWWLMGLNVAHEDQIYPNSTDKKKCKKK